MKNNKKKNKGITLISLVITIVILLILASVSISLLLGDNGLINKTKTAKKTYTSSDIEEKIKIAISDKETEKEGGASLNDLDDIKIDGYNDVNIGSIGRIVTVKSSGETYTFWIDSNLNVSKFDGGSIESSGNNNTTSSNTSIKDFTPSISNINGSYFQVAATAESDDSTVVAYEVFVNNEYKGITLAENFNVVNVTNLNMNTDYSVYVIALDDKGTIKKSNIVIQKTLDKVYLYKNGDECNLATGGWVVAINEKGGTGSKKSDNIYMYSPEVTSQLTSYGFRTYNKFDASRYSKMHVKMSSKIYKYNLSNKGGLFRTYGMWDGTSYQVFNNYNYNLQLTKGITEDLESTNNPVDETNVEKVIDISGITGQLYPSFMICAGGCGESLDMSVYEVWLEE